VIPTARRRGLGRALVLKALQGFRDVGCAQTTLEATAENAGAVKLYASLGFVVSRVSYVESYVETGKQF
jgi:ribosomal protein S18 acetylase RimI-like enzyme